MKKLSDSKKYHINYAFIQHPKIFGDAYLYQAGKMFCDTDTVVPSHTHIDWFELTIVSGGKGEIYTNRKKLSVSEGDIVLSFPYDIHKIVSDEENPLKFSFIAFKTVDEALRQDFEKISQAFYEGEKRAFHDPNVAFLTEMIISELSSPSYQQESVLGDLLHTLILLVVRAFLYKQSLPTQNHTKSNEVLCHKVMRYIDNNLFVLENLADVAEYFHYNYSYLSTLFKQTTNRTLTQYFTEQKLERAKLLIREGKLSFTEIASLLRYASLYSFSKSFKGYFGISPRAYQKSKK
jgi:AraC-like DNA-binding protein/quercetin dioxygenase-like cupin family protein